MELKEKLSLHPFLFGIFPIIFIFAINIQEIRFIEIVPLVAVILVITFILLIFTSIIFKNKKSGSFVISIGIILFFSYGHLYSLVESNVELRHIFLVGVFAGLFILSIYYFSKTKRDLKNATKILNAIAVTLIAISLFNIVSENIQGNYNLDFVNFNQENGYKDTTFSIGDKPDVYYIILDAYAGAEILDEYFGFKNQEFVSFLEEKGFYVVKNSQANYPTTTLSLSSSLNMEHIECKNNSQSCKNVGPYYESIQNNKVMKKFNSEGYKIVNFYSGAYPTTYFKDASNLCGKFSNIINSELTITVLGKSLLYPIYVKLFEDERREMILCVFSELENVQHNYDKPIFVLAHLIIPHHPYIFGPNGESVSPEKLEIGWEGLENDKEGYLNQVKFVNKKIKQVVTNIIDESEISPIIIIQGDHGLKTKIEDYNNPSDKVLRERFSILNAYHLPNQNESVYQNITPVNSFRIVINELFNEENELLSDSSYWLNSGPPSNLKEVTSILSEE